MTYDTEELCGDKSERGYNMICTSGKPFWPMDPQPYDVRIEDIAQHLSRICRFNGALRSDIPHYSVAQHSVLVADHVPAPYKLRALLHDAAEAYMGDVIKPVKAQLGEELGYMEDDIMWAIEKRFHLDYGCTREDIVRANEVVKEADYRAFLTEKRDLVNDIGLVDFGRPKAAPWDDVVAPLDQRASYMLFMERFEELYEGE